MYRLAESLYPICRSITGDGVRQTLRLMQHEVPLELIEVPSGSDVFDWQVPPEWNVSGASLEDADGRSIVDFADHNLHVVNYSAPVDDVVELADLEPHLFTDPRDPTWIPYRTSYYARNWGFCLSDETRQSMLPGKYRVNVDSRLEPGSLTYGELLIPGSSSSEVLIYSHTCHPSLANDNLSGLAITTWLAQWLLGRKNRFSYRFVWGPGTIGSLTWLANNRHSLGKLKHVLVCCLLGRPGKFHYKQSHSGVCDVDELLTSMLDRSDEDAGILPFGPYGYDERQFCSPGFRLPAGRLTRFPNDSYPEYHSSADNMSLIDAQTLEESLDFLKSVCEEMDGCRYYRNMQPFGEPQLGKRGLYGAVGGMSPKDRQQIMLWLLNQCDGSRSIQRLSRSTGFELDKIQSVADELLEAGLLTDADTPQKGRDE